MLITLKWDSSFLKRKIASLIANSNSDVKKIAKDLNFIHKTRFDCIYLFVNIKFGSLLTICNHQGWEPVENRVEMIKKIEKKEIVSLLPVVTSIKRSKVKSLYSLAGQLSRESRFFKDPFLRSKARKLYETWVYRSIVNKYAKKYFVALNRTIPVGLCTLRVREGALTVDLFVVKKTVRQKGIGTTLINIAQNWAVDNGYWTLKVITSKENIPALKFYRKCGFRIHTESWVYHIWQ